MKILIACEESQAVCKEFRKLGHEAFSCDILPCSGGHPEWHIQGDVLEIMGNGDKRILIVEPDKKRINLGKPVSSWYANTLKQAKGDLELLSRIRSKTFSGIAKAMAQQWGAEQNI